ncbi:unnamed protein product, partial [Scytosiphon promiscuus]
MVVGCQPFAGESMRWIKDTVSGLANPHDAAARNRVSKMEKYVMQGGDVNKPNKLGDTPLHEACAYIRDNGESSKNRRRKATVKDRKKIGKRLSRRHMGESGPLEMLELLLKAGSDIDAQNIVGDAPLHKAAMNGRARAADYLIGSGANVNIRNAFDQTPLHSACVSGNIEVVQRLVQGGADTSAQDAAEDTPFHEACRHQYESIVIYLMGLVNNPDTSQALKLWRGLDPSWEQVLRSRAQARVDDGEELDGKPVEVTAGAAAGLNSARLGVSTPSTTHNSLRSSESAMGLGLANRTPFGRGQVAANGSRDRGSGGGGVTVSVRGSTRGSKKASSPGAPQARGSGDSRQRKRGSESPATGAALGPDGAVPSSSSGVARTDSATRRRRRDRSNGSATAESSRRPFTTGADADAVLDWQATKAKSVEQGRVIEKARLALREEQQEEAMAMSTTTQGDDDCSVDTLNTADTPTTNTSSRNGRPREQRKSGGGKASPAAAAAKVGVSNVDAASAPGFKRVEASTRRATATTASRGDVGETRAKAGSPVMPTPPHTEIKDVREHAPPREVGRRQSARKSRGQAIPLRSPPAQVSRRASGSALPKNDSSHGSSSRRPSRRGSGSRSSSDRRVAASAADGSAEGGQDADDSRRSSRARLSRASTTDAVAAGTRRSSPSDATAETSARPRRRSSREGDGDRRGGDVGGEGRRERRTSSSRRERHRHREGETAPGVARSSPREEGGRSRRRHHSSRREGGEPAGGAGDGDGGRRTRESRRPSRGSDQQSANGELPAGAAPSSAASAEPTSIVDVSEAAAVAVANGQQRAPTAVAKAVKAPHFARTPRAADSLSAHFMTHGTASRAREGGPSPSRTKDVAASPSRKSEAREHRTPGSSRRREVRPAATAAKQRPSGLDLRPPTWASDIPSELEVAAPRKKVIASDFPVKRNSPYSIRRPRTQGASCSSPARESAGLNFSSSPSVRRSEAPAACSSPARVTASPQAPSPSSFKKPEALASCGSPARGRKHFQAPSPASSRKPDAPARGGGPSSDSPWRQSPPSPDAGQQGDPAAFGSPARESAGAQAPSPSSSRKLVAPAACGSPALVRAGPRDPSPSSFRKTEAVVACGSPARAGAGSRTPSPSGARTPRCHSACGSPARLSAGSRNSASPSRRAVPARASRPVAKTMDLRDDSDSETTVAAVSAAIEAASSSPAKRSSSAVGAEAEPSSHRSSPESSTKTPEDDFPPLIDALMMDQGSVGGGAATQGSEEVVRKNLDADIGSPMTPSPGATRKSFQTKAMVLAKSKSILFSDSDTDSDDDRSSGMEASQHRSQADAKLIAALSAVSKAFLHGRDEGVAGGAASTFGSSPDKKGIAAPPSPSPSLSPAVLDSEAASEEASEARAPPTEGHMPPPPPPPAAAVAVAVEAAAAAVSMPLAESAAGAVVGNDEDKGVEAPAAPAEDVRTPAAVEPSSAPRVQLKGLSSTATLPFSTKATPAPTLSSTEALPGARRAVLGGGARGRSSALGRPGTAAAKVTMPIAGGRAAWNKFLATTTPGEAERGEGEGEAAAAAASSTDALRRDGDDGGASARRDGAGCPEKQGATSPAEVEQAPVVPDRAPRGFKSAAEAQEGSNKGPAGAFSGNAMWRLAGSTTSAASRARTGIAANGHGGYSNPLAAMRAGGDGAGSGTGITAGGTAMANPLAGLRGAA